MNPLTEKHESPEINGDCWRAFVYLRATHTNIKTFTIDNDQGLGVILQKPGEPINLKLDMIDTPVVYDNFDKYRKEWLNLVSKQEGLKIIEEYYA